MRTQFTNDQLIALVRAAKGDEKAWYRLEKKTGRPTYDLLTLLSSDVINQIRRNHPSIFKIRAQEKPRKPCPVCGSAELIAGCCAVCHFDLSGEYNRPEIIKEYRLQAVWRGALEPRTEKERVDAEAWHERSLADFEEAKKKNKQPAEVAA